MLVEEEGGRGGEKGGGGGEEWKGEKEISLPGFPVAQWLRITCQCRGHGFKPWSGKIPHATEQLSPCATTTEPVL